jgi:hypothetical protein
LAFAIPSSWRSRHRLRDVGAIFDAHYLNRDPAMAESAVRKLEPNEKKTNPSK